MKDDVHNAAWECAADAIKGRSSQTKMFHEPDDMIHVHRLTVIDERTAKAPASARSVIDFGLILLAIIGIGALALMIGSVLVYYVLPFLDR